MRAKGIVRAGTIFSYDGGLHRFISNVVIRDIDGMRDNGWGSRSTYGQEFDDEDFGVRPTFPISFQRRMPMEVKTFWRQMEWQ
jgi:hypothetical protein